MSIDRSRAKGRTVTRASRVDANDRSIDRSIDRWNGWIGIESTSSFVDVDAVFDFELSFEMNSLRRERASARGDAEDRTRARAPSERARVTMRA